MLKHLARTSLRNLFREGFLSAVMITGLSIALACAFLLLSYIRFELSFDEFHRGADRIYRVTTEFVGRSGDLQRSALTPGPLRDMLLDNVPEIESAGRLFTYSWREVATVRYGRHLYSEENFFLADPSIFDVLSFSFRAGTPSDLLSDPATIVISESTARKYFGALNPMGQTLTINLFQDYDFTVVGVYADLPASSHLAADLIAPHAAGRFLLWEPFGESLSSRDFYTYVSLREAVSQKSVAQLKDRIGELLSESGRNLEVGLQPLTDIHLSTPLRDDLHVGGDRQTVNLAWLIVAIVIALASINFLNLSVARSMRRATEIGIRKSIGATRYQIAGQFFAESLIATLSAAPFAILLAAAAMPVFRRLVSADVPGLLTGHPASLLLYLLTVLFVTGLVAGAYPAVYLSGFQPVVVLKGLLRPGRSAAFRQSLLIVQFAVAIAFIAAALVVARQMQFVRQSTLGLVERPLVALPIKNEPIRDRLGVFREEVLENTSVERTAATAFLPGHTARSYSQPFGPLVPDGSDVRLRWNSIDSEFLNLFDIPLLLGAGFPSYGQTDATTFVLNESAVRMMGWTQPVGMNLSLDPQARMPIEGTVSGVIPDVPYASFRQAVEPLVLVSDPSRFEYLIVDMPDVDVQQTLSDVEQVWQRIYPDQTFDFVFLDSYLEQVYSREVRTEQLARWTSVIVLILAGTGLFGLASLSVTSRRKEIGIRKAFGASRTRIAWLVAGEMAVLMVWANVVAWPVVWYGLSAWLDGFAYRIDFSVGFLVAAGLIVFLAGCLTISHQAVQAAGLHPAIAIRDS